MIEVAVVRQIAAPAPPHSRHFETPRWWPEWIAQVLAADASPEAAYPAAAAALRSAKRDLEDARVSADDWAVTVAQHQVFIARRARRGLLEAAAAPGPGSRLEWCLCADEEAAAG